MQTTRIEGLNTLWDIYSNEDLWRIGTLLRIFYAHENGHWYKQLYEYQYEHLLMNINVNVDKNIYMDIHMNISLKL